MRYDIEKYTEYIVIHKRKNGKYTDDELLEELKTFDIDNFVIYKASNVFREVSYKDFLELKYCLYLFVGKKERDNAEKWIEFIKANIIRVFYLNKPFPKFFKSNVIQFEELNKEKYKIIEESLGQ